MAEQVTFRIKNLNKFNKSLDNAFRDGERTNVRRAVFKSANAVKNTAVESIMKGGTGVIYEKYNPRRTHQASRAGEPPASDTGFLVSQITTQVKSKPKEVIGQIIASAPYAKYLEFGTVNMQARPYMHPALKKNKNKIKSIFKQEGVIG